jgi:hypothetical protein
MTVIASPFALARERNATLMSRNTDSSLLPEKQIVFHYLANGISRLRVESEP